MAEGTEDLKLQLFHLISIVFTKELWLSVSGKKGMTIMKMETNAPAEI